MLWLLLLSLSCTDSSPAPLLTCPEGAPSSLAGRRGQVEYFTWNNRSSSFQQHCNFNDEKSLIGKDVTQDTFNTLNELLMSPHGRQGQAKQDIIISNMFKDYENPFYVDLASNHWIYISNTYMLDAMKKWRGICIEPTSQYLAGLVVNRSCTVVQSVVGAKDNDVIEYAHHGSLGGIIGKDKLSGMDNYAENHANSKYWQRDTLYTVSLTTILQSFKAPSVIEYLSLDVEGAEHLVLSGLDMSKYMFLAITVERPTNPVHTLLLDNGYRWVTRLAMFGECLYINKIHKQFDKIMSKTEDSRKELRGTSWKTGKNQPMQYHRYMMRDPDKMHKKSQP